MLETVIKHSQHRVVQGNGGLRIKEAIDRIDGTSRIGYKVIQ
jgi:hypothetical protein